MIQILHTQQCLHQSCLILVVVVVVVVVVLLLLLLLLLCCCCCCCCCHHLLGFIGVGSLSSTHGDDNVNESVIVLLSSLCTTGLRFLLLLGIDFWCLSFYLTGTGEGSVNFSSQQSLAEKDGR